MTYVVRGRRAQSPRQVPAREWFGDVASRKYSQLEHVDETFYFPYSQPASLLCSLEEAPQRVDTQLKCNYRTQS